MQAGELARSARPVARSAPLQDEPPAPVKSHDAFVGALSMAVGHEDVTIARDDDVGRRAELVGAVPGHHAGPELHENLALGAEFRDLLSNAAVLLLLRLA